MLQMQGMMIVLKVFISQKKVFTIVTSILLIVVFVADQTSVSEVDVLPEMKAVDEDHTFLQQPFRPTIGRSDSYMETIFRRRKEWLRHYCSLKQMHGMSSNDSVRLKYCRTYKLAVRTTPKVGSTLILQMLNILKYGSDIATEQFNKNRASLQNRASLHNKALDVTFTGKQLNKTLVIVPVRNPYSRLLAAYVDKIYLPNKVDLIRAVHSFIGDTKQPKESDLFLSNILGSWKFGSAAQWEHSVTFEDFLSYALSKKVLFKVFEDHYGPCFPTRQDILCSIDSLLLVKQETFAADIAYILTKVRVDHVDAESYAAINRSLEKSRAEVSVPGIIKSVFAKFDKKDPIWDWRVLTERLWHSFQIQGYISKKSIFPAKLFKSDSALNVSNVIDIVLTELKKHPMSPSETKTQRKEMMLTAYKQVNSDVIKKIQQVYADDFSAFQYDNKL